MKKSMRVSLAALGSLLMAAVLVIGAAAAPPAPFLGAWYSVDTDGSNQRLLIGASRGNDFRVAYFDDGATVCGLDANGDFLAGATAKGWLGAPGLTLSGYLTVICQFGPPEELFPPYYFEYTYDPATNTLTDIHGVVWTRGH